MVVTLPGGAQNLNVELQDDGYWVLIEYSWPKTMFNVKDLFKYQLDAGQFQVYHPMLTCFIAGLVQFQMQ